MEPLCVCTELVDAVRKNNLELAEKILKAKPQLLHTMDPFHPRKLSVIHIAAWNNNLSMVKMLAA